MFGVVPTHGPDCRTVRSYPTKCHWCGKDVHYFECSCGSKVFLVPGRKATHDCRASKSPHIPGYDELTRDNLVKCERCGMQVRGDRYANHLDSKCRGKVRIKPRTRF